MLIQEKGEKHVFVKAKNTALLFDYDWNFDELSCWSRWTTCSCR